ncbi:A-kinase anchor protein 6 [Aplochiton taeniatus]
MNVVAVSHMADAPTPMITCTTPTMDPIPRHDDPSSCPGSPPGPSPGPSPNQGNLSGEGMFHQRDPKQRSQKPPPLHTGADWKVVLHLPEIETWLRSTSDRVRDLTHSVSQDAHNRHVDVHLVQLKDICEDISDHVEQIHALLETEFSLKLLSYSVSIIVDIRSVQLLWHQLRVSVLVLKERLLQGLQDSNGNYTRQTDILQAFSQDHDQTRLDALTEVDDCGQLTIKCSQDYFSLDCGITAFELSDYSPSEEHPEGRGTGQEPGPSQEPVRCSYPELERDFPELIQSVDLLTIAAESLSSKQGPDHRQPCDTDTASAADDARPPAAMHSSVPSQGESPLSKRPLQGGSVSNEVSPTQPSLPKRAAVDLEGRAGGRAPGGVLRWSTLPSGLQYQAELSRSTPSLLEPSDPSKFWLELDQVYPGSVSQSYESLQAMNGRNLQRSLLSARNDGRQGELQGSLPGQRSSFEARNDGSSLPSLQAPASPSNALNPHKQTEADTCMEADSASPLLSPMREPLSSDMESHDEASGRPAPGRAAVWILQRQGKQGILDNQQSQESAGSSPDRERWYGSEEFLALPAQLKKTEILALKLESLAQAIPWKPSAGCDQEALQDVDDWDLADPHAEWEAPEGPESPRSQAASPGLLHHPTLPYRRPRSLAGCFSPTSSSDVAPSLDESIESGPLSDLLSEDEAGWGAAALEGEGEGRSRLQPAARPVESQGAASLIQQLLQDIQHQDKDPDIWSKIEGFVTKLDEFICWLRQALGTSENWTPPKADPDSLRLYLETHLSFKLDVDSHSALKETVLEEGRLLLQVIISHKSGVRDMLQMISGQWLQLQRQIRRQHGWMLRALHAIKARVLEGQSDAAAPASETRPANGQSPVDSPEWLCLRGEMRAAGRAAPHPQRPATLKHPSSGSSRCARGASGATSIISNGRARGMFQRHKHLAARRRPPCGRRSGDPHLTAKLPHGDALSGQRQAQRDALERMTLELRGLQYQPSTHRRQRYGQLVKNSSLQDFESDYQELWDWLMDMDAVVTDSHQLMMSEEQRQHLYKGNSVEMSIWQPKKSHLLGWAESLKRSGMELPADFDHRINSLTQKWDQLQKILGERCGSCSPVQDSRLALSPQTSSMVEQLEGRIKELKAWLRDTELLIFHSCLRHDAGHQPSASSTQLQSFKSLCLEVRGRRRGVASVLRLCQRLLEQGHVGPTVELGPGAEQHREALQLLSINLERRWEAIVMQALQWQNRLRRELGPQQVPGNFLEPGLVDLHHSPAGPAADDSWEWDEMDMTIVNTEPEPGLDLEGELQAQPDLRSPRTKSKRAVVASPGSGSGLQTAAQSKGSLQGLPSTNSNNNTYQVYSLHNIELYRQPSFTTLQNNAAPLRGKASRKQPLLKSLSKDSSFSSVESLPDLLSLLSGRGVQPERDRDSGRGGSGSGESARRSESESGIVSEGDTGATDHSESCRGQSTDYLSQGSSLESLLALGGELFPLQRSTSLESCLAPCRSAGEETEGSQASLGGDPPGPVGEAGALGESPGELSRRTLELLKRLENIQSPLMANMTRSVSDITLQSCALRLPASPSLGGRQGPFSGGPGALRGRHGGPPSSINESSAASLTELSSTEDSSMGSEDLALLRNPRLFLDATNASFRKRCQGNGRAAHSGPDEGDASVSMVVNVSCTSACTDEDEDDCDLLSSSTLTLTEEELGVREEGEEDGSSASSSGEGDDDEEEEEEEEDMEGSYILGLEYMKRELQSWIRPARSSSTSRTEVGLWDELQCGTLHPSTTRPNNNSQNKERLFLSRSALKLLEAHGNSGSNGNARREREREQENEEEENRRNATRSYISQFVDDMENGNVEPGHLRGAEEDAQLLREESSLYTKTGESFREPYDSGSTAGEPRRTRTEPELSSPSCELLSLPSKRASSLEGQLKGEIPCHSSSVPSPPSLSPIEDCRSHAASQRAGEGRQGLCCQESFSSFVTEESRRETRSKALALKSAPSCCHQHSPSPSSPSSPGLPSEGQKRENVHDFVMEIIDMTSVALKNKENRGQPVQHQGNRGSSPEPSLGPASLALIREKVLEHSHRPIHLRKGDFYSYLSLSSHDSDCGEVSQCVEEKSSTPGPYGCLTPGLSLTPDIRDEETLFEACTEEVYLGPPLCYSMVLTKRPRRPGSRPIDTLAYLTPSQGLARRLDGEEGSVGSFYFEGIGPAPAEAPGSCSDLGPSSESGSVCVSPESSPYLQGSRPKPSGSAPPSSEEAHGNGEHGATSAAPRQVAVSEPGELRRRGIRQSRALCEWIEDFTSLDFD